MSFDQNKEKREKELYLLINEIEEVSNTYDLMISEQEILPNAHNAIGYVKPHDFSNAKKSELYPLLLKYYEATKDEIL